MISNYRLPICMLNFSIYQTHSIISKDLGFRVTTQEGDFSFTSVMGTFLPSFLVVKSAVNDNYRGKLQNIH